MADNYESWLWVITTVTLNHGNSGLVKLVMLKLNDILWWYAAFHCLAAHHRPTIPPTKRVTGPLLTCIPTGSWWWLLIDPARAKHRISCRCLTEQRWHASKCHALQTRVIFVDSTSLANPFILKSIARRNKAQLLFGSWLSWLMIYVQCKNHTTLEGNDFITKQFCCRRYWILWLNTVTAGSYVYAGFLK